MNFFVVQDDSYLSIAEYIESQARSLAQRLGLIFYPELAFRRTLPLGTYVFCALDRLTAAEREITLRACDALSAAGSQVRLLNHPAKTLRRYDLLRRLNETGVNSFRAYRAAETRDPERYPVFLRMENEHTGDIGGLFHNRSQLYAGLARAMLLGHHLRELLIVEYRHTAGDDGFFRKYSAFVVGDQVLPRLLNVNRHWMVKAEGQHMDEATALEERRYICENPHEAMLRDVFRQARVEFGRADYSLVGDRLQIWEINLGPTIGRGPMVKQASPLMEKYRPLREVGRQHFYRRFQAALESIDTGADPRCEVSLALPEELRERFKRERRQQRRAMLHRNFVERVTYCSLMQRAKRLVKPLHAEDAPVLNRAGGTT
jgi:hypothetical protein